MEGKFSKGTYSNDVRNGMGVGCPSKADGVIEVAWIFL